LRLVWKFSRAALRVGRPVCWWDGKVAASL
jgi:hypothetical protein